MNSSIQTLCIAVKKIISQLKPQADGFSFLILTGKTNQGKKTLLRQSQYQQVEASGEVNTDIFYNQHGIIVELSELWLHQSKMLLQQTLKQLNNCHHNIKITGLLLCVDIHELTSTDPDELSKNTEAHGELLSRFGTNLGYRVDISVILTKLDTIAGFCEFYQQEHASELCKPLGFSLTEGQNKTKLEKNIQVQFNQFITSLNQQTLNKVHPARSGIKRTLIREFPSQLASLQLPIQALILCISPKLFRVQSVFFTSAEQGGFSLDQLNKKIQHEYALTTQDKFPLSNNYRAYFIQGALLSFQTQTKQYGFEKPVFSSKNISILASLALVALTCITYTHFKSNRLLDKASKEWLAYDAETAQNHDNISALFHLSSVASTLKIMNDHLIVPTSVKKLKSQLEKSKATYLQTIFLPGVIKKIETCLTDNQQPLGVRYQALKIYLMIGSSQYYQPEAITTWFKTQASQGIPDPDLEKKLAMIRDVLKQTSKSSLINPQIVSDTRNYFNSLPVSYLYYAIAKNNFSTEKQPIEIKGFMLAENALPSYFTKAGFHTIIQQFPHIATQLRNESWVLSKQVPDNLSFLLEQAYSYDYALWWKNFIKKTTPLRIQTYQDALRLTQTLRQSNAIDSLTSLIQEQTSPELGASTTEFNQEIASQFTGINLLNRAAIPTLSQTINEMEKFLTTLSIVNDKGKTAFTLTKARFQGDSISNPLTLLFTQAEQLPEPLAAWTKQIANDAWFILINDTKHYINAQWQGTVYHDYVNAIAKRYPFDQLGDGEVAIADFNRFFSTHGTLNTFIEQYIKPFLNTSEAQWKPKEINQFVLPISNETITEMMRANIITTMFFHEREDAAHIEFSLQKSDLDPVVSSLYLKVGDRTINDTQEDNSFTHFQWPQADAKLTLNTLEGKSFTLDEHGVWAFFKLLQKVDVQTDTSDSATLQVLFEINGNSGRYLLRTKNEINPFTPGILNGFNLSESLA